MFYVNLVLAFVAALTAWVVGSTALASFIFKTETKRPELANRAAWNAVETALVFCVFAASVGLWIWLTWLLQQVSK